MGVFWCSLPRTSGDLDGPVLGGESDLACRLYGGGGGCQVPVEEVYAVTKINFRRTF